MIRARFVVHGRVQGVGFRMSACGEARRLQLGGFVRNRNDGAVEGEAVGPPPAVASFREWLGRGPGLARVDRLQWDEVAQPSAAAPVGGFEIVADH